MKFNLTALFIHLPFFGVSFAALLVLLQDQRWKVQEEATCLKIKLYSVCEIRDKMQVIYKELTCDMGELHGKFTIRCI